jgi:hypothetical protein
MYYTGFNVLGGDYDELPHVRVVVMDSVCDKIKPGLNSLELPQGGRSLPIPYEFSECQPLEDVELICTVTNTTETNAYPLVVFGTSSNKIEKAILSPANLKTSTRLSFFLKSSDKNATLSSNGLKLTCEIGGTLKTKFKAPG